MKPEKKKLNTCPCCGNNTCGGRDYRGILTILIVVLAFGVAYIKLLTGQTDETLIPPWIAGLVFAAVGPYIMGRTFERMRAMTQEKERESTHK